MGNTLNSGVLSRKRRRSWSSRSDDSVPQVQRKRESGDNSEDETAKCPICLQSISTQELGSPDGCGSCVFCLVCLVNWSKIKNECPLDRKTFTQINVQRYLGGHVTRQLPIQDVVGYEDEDSEFCIICRAYVQLERFIICDGCEDEYHIDCLNPAMETVPEGDWYCQGCEERHQARQLTTAVPVMNEDDNYLCRICNVFVRLDRIIDCQICYYAFHEECLNRPREAVLRELPWNCQACEAEPPGNEPYILPYCRICKTFVRDSDLITCGGCEMEFHLNCLKPLPIEEIPEWHGEWFCETCEAQDQQ